MMLDHNNSMALVEESPPIIYNGEVNIHKFYIGPMSVNVSNHGKETKFIVSIQMDHIYNDQMINTFIPTFLLWLLGYSTLFINIENFNDRFMGTATSLLVLASLLSSINTSLPKTSYFKYIDLWFLWYLANIFCIIIYHIALDTIKTTHKDDLPPAPLNNKVKKLLPLKIRIGQKTKIHSLQVLSDEFDKAFSGTNSKDESTANKNSINKKAKVFFPILIVCFNITYFIVST